MSEQRQDRARPLVIQTGDELMRGSTRRDFVRMLSMGGAVVMLPGVFSGCATTSGMIGQAPDSALTFDLRSDVGIFRLVHALEQLKAAFYTAVVASGSFASFFNAIERELLVDLRNVEIVHREFFRTALGSQAVPDLTASINTSTLNAILATRQGVLGAARLFEHLGVSGPNGAGKYLQGPRNLLVAGKAVSVEARHAAALRDVSAAGGQDAATAFAGDDIVDGNGMDVKLEAGAVLDRVAAVNIVRNGAISARNIPSAPGSRQGRPSADFVPANPERSGDLTDDSSAPFTARRDGSGDHGSPRHAPRRHPSRRFHERRIRDGAPRPPAPRGAGGGGHGSARLQGAGRPIAHQR